MILLTQQDASAAPKAGVKTGDDVVDIAALLECDQEIRDVKMLMERYPDALDRIQKALDEKAEIKRIPLKDVKLFCIRPRSGTAACLRCTQTTPVQNLI